MQPSNYLLGHIFSRKLKFVARNKFALSVKKKEGLRLRKLRGDMGMSVREFAKEFRVSIGAISQWENGERKIPGPMTKLVEIYEQSHASRKSD